MRWSTPQQWHRCAKPDPLGCTGGGDRTQRKTTLRRLWRYDRRALGQPAGGDMQRDRRAGARGCPIASWVIIADLRVQRPQVHAPGEAKMHFEPGSATEAVTSKPLGTTSAADHGTSGSPARLPPLTGQRRALIRRQMTRLHCRTWIRGGQTDLPHGRPCTGGLGQNKEA